MKAKGMGDNKVSSIKVGGGANCCAKVYQHGNFDGLGIEFPPGNWNNDAFKNKGMKNDAVSSLRVWNGGCYSDRADKSACKVTVYQHGSFNGAKATYTEGSYNNKVMKSYGMGND